MKITITGVTGNMGLETLAHLLENKDIEKFKLLILKDDKRIKKIKRRFKAHLHRFEFVLGNLAEDDVCDYVAKDVDYVVNLASVIPPHSDQHPEKAVECNEIGVKKLINAIEKLEKQPKLIHISTIALYGNRNYKHPWVRVGDPLLVSPYDIYSATKLRGEFAVLESNIKDYVVLRQTAMLHSNMLSGNMSDGLMFHTCFNAPLEWATAHDSGLLIANIIKKDSKGEIKEGIFWHKVFNIGGGEENCITGYDTMNDGFKIVGGSAKDFFRPYYNNTRNFHGVWFYDGNVLDDMFDYQTQTVDDFWNNFAKSHKIFKAGKIVPKALIRQFAIKRLFKNYNSPVYWAKHNEEEKLFAFFGGRENYEKLPRKNWEGFNLLVENKNDLGEEINYNELRTKKNAKLIDYKIDLDGKIGVKELDELVKAHGGKMLTKKVDEQGRYEFENSDGEKFKARAYTVVAGHWWNKTYTENCWDFDRLAKKDEIYAQVWYDSHGKNEDKFYYLDERYKSQIKDIEK